MFSLVIVDDDELVRKGLEKIIPWPELGFEVRGVFADASSALGYLRENRTDAVLTDVKMPGMSGLELVEEAKKLNPSLKAVIISGYSEFELVKNALLLKAEDYLLKPLSQKDIEKVFLKVAESLREPPSASGSIDTCYELLRIISEEYRLWTAREPARLCLLYSPEGTDAEMVKGLMAAAKDGFLAFLCPESALEEPLEALKGPGRKIAAGSRIIWEDDIAPSFWSAFNLLPLTPLGSVSRFSGQPQALVDEARSELIAQFEGGGKADSGKTVEKVRTLKAEDQGYVYCSVVLKLLHYFTIEDQGSFRFASCNLSSASPEELEGCFRSDIALLGQLLSEKGDLHSRLLAQQAKKIVEEEYADPELSLSSVSGKLGISYGYLSAIFPQAAGKSFKSYLVDVRMTKARELLLTRDYRIYEIAELTGYTGTKYFTEAFQRYYGASPLKYLQNLSQ